MASSCRSCRAPIEWVTLDSGKLHPLDVGPTAKSTIVDVRADGGKVFGVVLSGRRSHFATCPTVLRHRKGTGEPPIVALLRKFYAALFLVPAGTGFASGKDGGAHLKGCASFETLFAACSCGKEEAARLLAEYDDPKGGADGAA